MRNHDMKRILTAAVALTVVVAAIPAEPAAAQDALGGALLGGAAGAIIGGAATGRAGGAVAGGIIGAAAGAAIGASMEPRRGRYYWYQNGCWLQRRDGSYIRVNRGNCY
jgi:outer membrane lipoprotein SlyB